MVCCGEEMCKRVSRTFLVQGYPKRLGAKNTTQVYPRKSECRRWDSRVDGSSETERNVLGNPFDICGPDFEIYQQNYE